MPTGQKKRLLHQLSGLAHLGEVRVIQGGSDNIANVTQGGLNSVSYLNQLGTGNDATVTQSSDNNQSYVVQNGTGNVATVTQGN